MRWFISLLVCIAVAVPTTVALAQFSAMDVESANRDLDRLQAQWEAGGLDQIESAELRRQGLNLRTLAIECIASNELEVERIEADLDVLSGGADPLQDPASQGPAATDTADLIEQRATFEVQIRQLRSQIADCRVVQLRAQMLVDATAELQRKLSYRRLLQQGPGVWRVAADMFRHLPGQIGFGFSHALDGSQLGGLSIGRWVLVLLVTVAAWGLGRYFSQLALPWCDRQRGRGSAPAPMAIFARVIANRISWMLAALTALILVTFFADPPLMDIFLERLLLALALYTIGLALIDWYTGHYSPGAGLVDLNPETTLMVRTRLHALLIATLVGLAIFGTEWFSEAPVDAALGLRLALTLYFVTCVIWVIRCARFLPAMRGRVLPLRFALILAAFTALVAELLGYRNLANFSMAGVLFTLIGGLVLWTGLWLTRETVRGITHGKSAISYRIRDWLGMRPDESSAELGWLRLVIGLTLWLAFATYLIAVWDFTGNAIAILRELVVQGFSVGDNATIVPRQIFVGISAFGVIIALTAWIKARMSNRWLRDLDMDRGSREALVTLGGYVGFVVATIIGLLLSGVEFAGLALIVGALSVGIGFGLQNIVNNFVSGLILLFERPIKSGDFVSVGTVEGIVKQIRIRSTEIETLDRQNVIVPNSELVSTQVTNWVLHDSHGRLQIPVGVAYGSDTEKVRDILEEIAEAHPQVLSQGRVPKPRALFLGFGDSSLDFELRVWIRQIERRFRVTSDLNFAIDKAFREHGVEIPFPQRDLHVRSWAPAAAPGMAAPPADTPAPAGPTTESEKRSPDKHDRDDD